jgi:hypothetical protein
VPSLSNTAIRSATGTNSFEPSVVVFFTKSKMADLFGPSFHDGSGSTPSARAIDPPASKPSTIARIQRDERKEALAKPLPGCR